MRRIFSLIVVLILYGSLYPFHFVPRVLAHSPLWVVLHRWDSWKNPYLVRDLVVNIALYVPVGIWGNLALRGKVAVWGPVLFALLLSISMEVAQVFEPARYASSADTAANVAGAAIGVCV